MEEPINPPIAAVPEKALSNINLKAAGILDMFIINIATPPIT